MPVFYVSLELANGEIVTVKVTAADQAAAETQAKAISLLRTGATVGTTKVITAR